MPRYNPLLDQLHTYPAVAVERRKAELIASGRVVFDFGKGDPEEPPPAFVPEALRAAIVPRMPYPTVAGSTAVREAIAGYMERRFSVLLDPDTQVLPTAGSKEAVFHMPLLIIDPGAEDRTVVFPNPGYPVYQRGALFAGADAYGVQLEGDHILRPWTLPAAVVERTRLIWLNTPHNPSGATMGLADLQRAADFCRARNILLVADEAYTDLYQDAPPHSLLECGTDGLLVLHSCSKRSGMTGYRSGFLAGDAEIIAKLAVLRTNPGLVPTDFVNAAAAAAWSDDAHVLSRRKVFAQKKAVLLSFFDQMGWDVVGREASLYLWLRVPGGDDEAYAERLLSVGIVVSPGRIFGVAGGGVGYVRLAMVPTLDQCVEAVSAWRGMEEA